MAEKGVSAGSRESPREFFESLVNFHGMPDSAALEWLNFVASMKNPLYSAIAKVDALRAAESGVYSPADYYNSAAYPARAEGGSPGFTGEFGNRVNQLPQLAGSVGAGRFATQGGMGGGQRAPYGMPASSQKLIDMLLGGGR